MERMSKDMNASQSKIENRKSKISGASTYRAAGVDIEGANGWLAKMRPLIRSTRRSEVLPDRGQFAGLFRFAASRWRDPILVASTDGAGTKLKVAQLAEPAERSDGRQAGRGPGAKRWIGAYEAIGVDVVAMNVNDVVTYGAEPLFFLDYLAIGKLQPALMSALLKGIVRGCRESGCALLGGETAEMPGVYEPGEYDVAGFCVGVVERSKLIDGSAVRKGDIIVGVASSGVHANGFSLVRRVLTEAQVIRLARRLLIPTRIYVKPILRALRQARVHGIAHVTGGGLAHRLPSLVSTHRGLRACLAPKSWPIPAIFRTIQATGGISMDEMMATFNMGVGMVLACPAADAKRLVRLMHDEGMPAWPIGTIEGN